MPCSSTARRFRERDEPEDPLLLEDSTNVVEESERLRRLGIIDANGNLRIPIEPSEEDDDSGGYRDK